MPWFVLWRLLRAEVGYGLFDGLCQCLESVLGFGFPLLSLPDPHDYGVPFRFLEGEPLTAPLWGRREVHTNLYWNVVPGRGPFVSWQK